MAGCMFTVTISLRRSSTARCCSTAGNSIVHHGSPGHLLSKTEIIDRFLGILFTSSLLLCCGKHVSALFNILPASSLGCLWTPLVSIRHPFLPRLAPPRDVQKNKTNETGVGLTLKGVAAAGQIFNLLRYDNFTYRHFNVWRRTTSGLRGRGSCYF